MITSPTYRRLALLLIAIAAVAGAMAALLSVTTSQVHQVDHPNQIGMARLAWASLLALGLVLILLLWAIMRFVSARMRPQRHAPTDYIDAWSLAGERMKLPDDDQELTENDPSTDPEDDPDKPSI